MSWRLLPLIDTALEDRVTRGCLAALFPLTPPPAYHTAWIAGVYHVAFDPASLELVHGFVELYGACQEDDLLATAAAGELTSKGMTLNETKPDSFREALRKAGFYAEWKKKYGDEAWAILEKAVGSTLS